jgi:hypothetical protein
MSILKRKKTHKHYNSEVSNEHVAQGASTKHPVERVPTLNQPIINIVMDDVHFKELEPGGFSREWLMSLANRYNFNKIEYIDKFKGFRCYQNGKMVDTITVNDLASLNGNKRLTKEGQPFRYLDKKKQVIKMNWRK